jgi:ubiquinone biosynthesis protein UbiJ
MDALETALLPVIRMINRQIGAKTPARELCAELDGRSLAVRINNTALAACVRVHEEQISMSAELPDEPDVVICGSLLSLLKLSGSGEQSIRDGSVDISGDAETAERFQKLLAYGKPDLEEELSGVIGDVAAHSIGNFARSLGNWSRNAGTTMQQNVTEYLQEESHAVPSRYEVDKLRDHVDEMRDDVDRFEAKLKQHERRTD